ncbi:MAG: hypothetical protein OXM87_13015 [Truepera sp.]|nr:hypothetical protein [Truepera sp.]
MTVAGAAATLDHSDGARGELEGEDAGVDVAVADFPPPLFEPKE